MIKTGEPNPLNIFNMRRLNYCSPHLERVYFDIKVHDKIIIDWIYENLEGRFYYGDELHFVDNKAVIQKCVAFEIQSEASFFCFALENINKHLEIWP
jgi:hypothetical protein